MSGTHWTQEEELKLKEYISLGQYGFRLMAQFFPGRTGNGLQNHARTMNIDATYKYHIHTFDESFFETPNYINCFFGGWLAADGCLYNYCGERYQLEWRMSDEDEYFLKLFKKYIKYTGDIRYIKAGGYAGKTKDGLPRRHAKLAIARVDIGKFHLKKYGVIPDKTKRIPPPEIKEIELCLAYIMGYINGDGCVYFPRNKANGEIKINISSCSLDILDWINNFVESLKLPKASKKTKKKSRPPHVGGAATISFRGLVAIYLYEILNKLPVPKLERKWGREDINKYIEETKIKHPDWFAESVEDVMARNNIDFSRFPHNYPLKLEENEIPLPI